MFSDNVVNEESTEEIGMPVFSETSSSLTVTEQPLTRDQERALQTVRRPIPISIISSQGTTTSHFSPLDGLGFLQDVNTLIIQQTVELTDLMSDIESENRYIVKVPREETIYYATEISKAFQRNCFGSGRAFSLSLYDPTQQEAMYFKRRLACGSCCSAFFYLQELEVWKSPNEYIGKIKQNFSVSKPNFTVFNDVQEVVYRIDGPESFMGCLLGKNLNFQIYSGDGATQMGSIVHQWDQFQANYNLFLQLPGNNQNIRHKALLLGAAFLLEYMYFESAKRRRLFRCIC